MIKILIFLPAILLFALQAEAQIYSQLFSGRQEMFLEAESYFLFEEYNEALPLYLELLKDQPDNAFIYYRAGTCCIHTPGQKEKAIAYLEKAVENIDPRNRRPTFRSTQAPLDALFHLGNAYHVNYRFREALEIYSRFRDKMTPSVYNADVVDAHIEATLNAIESVDQPIFFIEENLGERINTRFSETNPVVSANEEVLVFTRELPFYDGIFFSERTDQGEWSWPLEITSRLGSDGDFYPVSLSSDGRELYLYKSDDLVGNIYVSRYSEDKWSAIEKLNDNINSGYWESHASISASGDTLYFASNRPGGFGGLDLYYSVRDERGKWGPAINLGKEINTPYNEDTPFISGNGRTLYFSSHGHKNIGGYDIFSSTRKNDGSWSTPVNAGYGINTPDDDLFFVPVQNGKYAYYSKFDNEGFGEMDIYRYEIFSEKNPRKFLLTGKMLRAGGLQPGAGAEIKVVDPENANTVYSGKPDRLTGAYEITVGAGEWEVFFCEEGYEEVTKTISLAADREDNVLMVNVNMEREESGLFDIRGVITDSIILPPETRLQERTLGIDQHYYRITGKEKIRIPLKVESNTILEVEKIIDGASAGTEEIMMNAENFTYEYDPVPGNNILRFINAGKNGDVVTEEVIIGFDLPDQEEVLIPEDPVMPDNDTVIAPEYFETPDPEFEEEETPETGRANRIWLILILSLLLLIAYYFKERHSRKTGKE